MTDTITVYAPGHWDYLDSYGLIACQLARHLTRLGMRVNAVAMGETVMDSQPADVRAVTTQPMRASFGGIFLGYPDGYARHSNPLARLGTRVALTMFESSRMPASWLEPLNRMDAVIVPSTFCADVFIDCGVTAPVYVVPLGVSDTFQYAPRPQDRPLTFLAFLDRGARKGGMVALQAFLGAFGEDMNYRLILKGRRAKHMPFTLTNPNIEVIQQDMDEAELYQLYLRADVLINAHKGEGFGMIPREAARTGCLALTTDWSGTADDLDLWGLPLSYTMERADWRGARNLEGQELGDWACVDPVAVAEKLLTIAANRAYYAQLAETMAYRASALYAWPTFAAEVLDIWRGVAHVAQPAMHASAV